MKIKIKRNLIPCGPRSKGVTLPKFWLTYIEQKEGKKIAAISMDVDGYITLNPLFEKQSKEGI